MVVVFLISSEDTEEHKQKKKFLTVSYTEYELDLLFFFIVGQNHVIISLHQSIEASNNGIKIDNRLYLASLINFLHISMVYFSVYVFL